MAERDDSWIEEEFRWADLGDERLNWRLKKIIADLAAQPMASLPQASEDLAALKATYRFFDNKSIKAPDLLLSHQAATLARVREHAVILAVQDTTFLDFTAHPQTQALGPLATEHNRGLCSHNTLAFTPERLPLGLLQQQVWVRDEDTYGKQEPHKTRKIQDKESQKWLTSLEALNKIAPLCKETKLISVGDAEADIFDFFHQKREANVEFLVRACQDRCVEGGGRLRSRLQASAEVAQLVVNLQRRGKEAPRTAHLRVRYENVKLLPPQARNREGLEPVSVGVILVHEDYPPAGCKAVDWLLITTLSLGSVVQALECVDWYCVRWQIEIWHKVLKSGCRFEGLQLGHADRLERCLALYSVIAWRLLYAVMLSRTAPHLSCELLLDPWEWKALYCHVYKRSLAPSATPDLKTAVAWIGRLGGYLGRNGDGPPGATVLWRGLQRLGDITEMYRIMSSPSPPTFVGKA